MPPIIVKASKFGAANHSTQPLMNFNISLSKNKENVKNSETKLPATFFNIFTTPAKQMLKNRVLPSTEFVGCRKTLIRHNCCSSTDYPSRSLCLKTAKKKSSDSLFILARKKWYVTGWLVEYTNVFYCTIVLYVIYFMISIS